MFSGNTIQYAKDDVATKKWQEHVALVEWQQCSAFRLITKCRLHGRYKAAVIKRQQAERDLLGLLGGF